MSHLRATPSVNQASGARRNTVARALVGLGALVVDQRAWTASLEFGQWVMFMPSARGLGKNRSPHAALRQMSTAEPNRRPIIVHLPWGTNTDLDEAVVFGYAKDLLPLLVGAVDQSRGVE